MKRAIILIPILLWLAPFLVNGQIVNTEVKRIDNETEGWQGTADLNLSLIKNKKDILQLGSRINFHYYKRKNRLMILNDIGLFRSDKEPLVNQGFLHVRYSYEAQRFLIPEGFVQGQYNEIQLLEVRGLAGLGPRFRIIRNDSVRLYLGTLYMFEFERIKDQVEANIDHRMSAYLSASYTFKKTITLQSITYYQPRLDWWGDFRISSETSLKFDLTKKLYFSALFNLFYDTNPPPGVQTTFYTFKNSIGFKF
ncbi:MAG: DUF481 domain-containing protein [Bacteroidia bacterium]|nr:DUF481 domain-containing protein [Bacteroidia bacterium]